MTPEVLEGLLWCVRTGIRTEELNLFAGHGVADPSYRPPRLPYAAVIGPLNIEIESERELPRSLFLWVRRPGYLAGAERGAGHLVPAPGELHLLFDGHARIHVSLDFGNLAGLPLNQEATALQVAARIETAILERVDAGAVEVAIGVLSDARRAELRATTIRWDRSRHRLVIASGRRGVLENLDEMAREMSRVEVVDGPNNLASSLGFLVGSHMVDGRVVRHRIPNPTPVAVDVRLDLWAGSQRDLAAIMDQWARVAPTRGQLLLRPALLSRDARDGDEFLHLQRQGESVNPWTLLQLEPELGFADRLTGTEPQLANGAEVDDQGILLSGNATATIPVFRAPPVPLPWRRAHPAPNGYALTCGIQLLGGQAGESTRVLRLEHRNRTVLQIDLSLTTQNGTDVAEILATAEHLDGSPFTAGQGHIALDLFERGVDLHTIVSASAGSVLLFIDGGRLTSNQPPQEPSPGTPAGGDDMQLVLGDPEGAEFDFRLTHLQLHGRPLGPVDPALRLSLGRAGRWEVGDPIAVANTETGNSISGEPFQARVIAVSGDQVRLDRAVVGNWIRSKSLVYLRSLFFSQKQWRRRDDFMNMLYRITAEYRISAFLDDRFTGITAPLVDRPEVDVRMLSRLQAEMISPDSPDYPIRPAPGRPGVFTNIKER